MSDQRSVSGRWLSRGARALVAAALGLATAGTLTLTTVAQAQPADATGSIVRPLSPPPVAPTPDAAGSALRRAIVRERAAQRAEELTRTAAEAEKIALRTSGSVREHELAVANESTEHRAADVAAENLRQATAERLAAQQAQTATDGQEPVVTSTTAPTPTPTPAGTPSPGVPSPGPAVEDGVDPATIPPSGPGVDPVPGSVIGAHFGEYGHWSRYHTGLDFRAAYGTPIRAVQGGVVVFAGGSGDWAGIHVALRHADGVTSMSSHMSAVAVQQGQVVQAGQVIGFVGQTGRAFGAHLHFEIYPPGVRFGDVYQAVNPQPWLAAHGVATR